MSQTSGNLTQIDGVKLCLIEQLLKKTPSVDLLQDHVVSAEVLMQVKKHLVTFLNVIYLGCLNGLNHVEPFKTNHSVH